jgi:hypothetical protein
MAYRTAAGTGFRAEELRSLTPESFRLDRPDPSIFLKAAATKNRKPADQPITRELARTLREWLRGQPAGQSVFPLHHDTAKAIEVDLRECGIPYETEEGVADFHSLRAYYVSALVRSGRSIKEVQQLARHAKPETTLKHYAKVAAHDLRAAVGSLPSLDAPGPAPGSGRMVATGTYATHIDTLAPSGIPSPDAPGRSETLRVVMAESGGAAPDPAPADEKPPENQGFDASRRSGTLAGAERGGFEPPEPVDPVRRIDKRSPSRIAAGIASRFRILNQIG